MRRLGPTKPEAQIAGTKHPGVVIFNSPYRHGLATLVPDLPGRVPQDSPLFRGMASRRCRNVGKFHVRTVRKDLVAPACPCTDWPDCSLRLLRARSHRPRCGGGGPVVFGRAFGCVPVAQEREEAQGPRLFAVVGLEALVGLETKRQQGTARDRADTRPRAPARRKLIPFGMVRSRACLRPLIPVGRTAPSRFVFCGQVTRFLCFDTISGAA